MQLACVTFGVLPGWLLVKYTAFGRLLPSHVGQFTIYMHGDLKFLIGLFINLRCIHVQRSVSEL